MPTSPLINTLQQELSRLNAELEADPRFRKIQTIRALLAQYAEAGITSPQQVRAYAAPSPSTHKQTSPSRPDTKRERVHDVIHRILSSPPGKTHRRELLGILQGAGLLVEDKNPMATLAIYLSDFKDFRSAGGGYWEIVPETNEAPANTGASNSSDSGAESLFRETADHDR
jgi:hypothetical protein